MAQLLADGQPLAFKGPAAESFVWRGAAEAGALRELLADIAWGTLDVLLLDLPPGMQRFLELGDLLPAPPAVLTVTIPTPESRDAVRRAMRAAVERRAPLLGVVENMVGGPFVGTAGADLAEELALLTNPMETQLVSSLGVKIGGTTVPAEPLQTIRGMVATGRNDAFTEPVGPSDGRTVGLSWSVEAQERLARVPGFVRGMVKKIYADYAKEHGIGEITPAVMDAARTELGLEGM